MNEQVDEKLRRYELLIAHSRDIILFVRREDGRILEANAAATQAYGYSREELLTLTIHDLRADDTKNLTADQMAEADARGILFDTVHRRKDGGTFPVEVSSQGATIDGTRTLISIIRDITKRRATEAKLLSLARYPEVNPNPILRASDKGTLLYANQPAYAMMEPMGWREELPLPESLLIPIRDVLNEDRCREIELTCQLGKVWSLTLLPNVGEKHVTLYARDITAQKQAERALRESETRVREKLDSILSPEGDIGKLELADIIDAQALQTLMVHFYELAHFPLGIIDIKGEVLVGVGWQDICTRFHRVHPDACRHCIESDTQLSAGVPPGEFRLYKCKNNMWDVATPIMVGGQHVGNVFTGQFFFDDEPLDHELFRSQAREYGFDEKEYIAALETVPHVSRKSVNTCMAFFAKLADIISQLSYSNIKLARTMTEREGLMGSLRQNESLLRTVMDNSPDPIFLKNRDGQMLLANPATLNVWGSVADDIIGKTIREYFNDPEVRRTITENDRRVMDSGRTEVIEEIIPGPAGPRVFLSAKSPYYGSEGTVIGLVGIARDITDRKKQEEELRQLNRTLRALSNSSHALMRSEEEAAYLDEVCQIVVRDCGYAMVWIGYAENDEAKTIRPVAHAGFEEGYLETLNLTWADTERGRGPGGTAIRTGKPSMCSNMLTDPRFAPWRDQALMRGYASSLVLPLLAGGTAFGEITIYSKHPNPFSEDEVKLLTELANDLTHGITALRMRKQNQQAQQALRESEKRFRQLADAMPQLVWTATSDGRVDYFNQRLKEFNSIGQRAPVIHPKDLPRTMKVWQRGIKSGRDYEIEHRMQRADGRFRWFLSRAVPIHDESGCVIKWFATSTDVDERKQAEQALRHSKDELEKKVHERTAELILLLEDLEKSRDDLRKLASELVLAEERERKRLAVTLHDEVAQTLAAARMRVDLMKNISGGGEYEQSFKQVQELLSHAIQQTRGLMKDISNPVLYDMGLPSAVEDLAAQVKDRHGIQVKSSFEGNLRSLSQDLNVMIFQVVKELLQNVIKHSGARGVHVRIIEDKESIRTIVADDGVGFDVNDINSRDYVEGGFGLFSIGERVKSFNGNIQINSKPGIGSEVIVTLPRTARSITPSRKAEKRKKRT
jgi:PAS domain S-box-containing protein